MAYIYRLMPQDEVNPEHEEALLQTVLEIDGPRPDIVVLKEKSTGSVSPVALSDFERDPDWRDRPAGERTRLYWREGRREAEREAQAVWNVFKNDPLEPWRIYFEQYVVTGIGLFLEGWVIFSISNVSTLFKQSYKHCWGTSKPIHCNNTWLQATTYLQLVGILLGQLGFGFMGDWVGRKASMLTDMTVVLLGVIMLTVSSGTTEQGWVVMYGISQLVFGIGIGGEYPATSTRAVEESAVAREISQRHRGRKVMLAYTMQGWGQFFNLGTLLILLLIFNGRGTPPYSRAAAGATWRVSFAVLIPVVLYFLYYRIYVLKELKELEKAKSRDSIRGYDWRGFRLMMTHFWHRLLGTAGIWFCNDWYFYGNGVFRSTFVGILLGPGAGVSTNWLWSFLNAGIQLVGYYFAALSVDFRPWGRRRMTTFSFLMIGFIFLCCYAAYDRLVEKSHIQWFQFLYYISSFFGLFGSHTTSFLLAAESFPTSVRSTAHGISAAWGKVGSIGVTVWVDLGFPGLLLTNFTVKLVWGRRYNYVDSRTKFLIAFPAAFLGAAITWVFIADNTGLDLAEQDLRWQFIRAGKAKDYHGPAVHPRHLSLWEKWVLGIHHQYNPSLHQKQSQFIKESFQSKLKQNRAGRDELQSISEAMPKTLDGEAPNS